MEKFSNNHSKSELFFNSIIDSLSDKLSKVLSENIEDGWFKNYVYASVNVDGILYEIEYHPYRNEENYLVIMKDNGNDQLQNIENYILSNMDFIQIENNARDIYESHEYYEC